MYTTVPTAHSLVGQAHVRLCETKTLRTKCVCIRYKSHSDQRVLRGIEFVGHQLRHPPAQQHFSRPQNLSVVDASLDSCKHCSKSSTFVSPRSHLASHHVHAHTYTYIHVYSHFLVHANTHANYIPPSHAHNKTPYVHFLIILVWPQAHGGKLGTDRGASTRES